jgi:hypothetical protein
MPRPTMTPPTPPVPIPCSGHEPAGRKDDAGKPRWSLLPVGAVAEVIAVLEAGAAKYGAGNWQRVPDARARYYDAAMRHLEAWWAGEKRDPETGRSHLAHVACCVLFLLWLDREGGQ